MYNKNNNKKYKYIIRLSPSIKLQNGSQSHSSEKAPLAALLSRQGQLCLAACSMGGDPSFVNFDLPKVLYFLKIISEVHVKGIFWTSCLRATRHIRPGQDHQ
jgi:hypothetical protein